MSIPPSNLFLYIGKFVKDEYESQVGRIVSLLVSPSGQVTEVFVEHGDGEISRYATDQFSVDGDDVILSSFTRLQVNLLCDQIPLIWRKDQALSDIFKNKTVPSELYEELHKSFESTLTQLKANAQTTASSIDKQLAKSDQQIREVNSALVHLEIERELGKVNDETHQTAKNVIQERMKRTQMEKNDLEFMKKQLSNMLLGEKDESLVEMRKIPSTPNESAEKYELSEPPIIVHFKSADKSVS